jgi:predicted phosphodiesterase
VLALLYDVHGNLPALEAVLEDAERVGARRFLLGGDYALFGPFPLETVERLRQLEAEWIRGNGERWTGAPGEAPDDPVVQGGVAACREALGRSVVDELGSLPETVTYGGTLYCHASPGSDVRSFFPDAGDDEAELLAGVEAKRLVFGHTHLPFRRQSQQDVELVNPGSVGMPLDGDPRAAYAVIDDDGEVEHRRVQYDQGASARALRDRFEGEFAVTMAGRIERGSPEG